MAGVDLSSCTIEDVLGSQNESSHIPNLTGSRDDTEEWAEIYCEETPEFYLGAFRSLDNCNRAGGAAITHPSFKICDQPWPSPDELSKWMSEARSEELLPGTPLQLFFICRRWGSATGRKKPNCHGPAGGTPISVEGLGDLVKVGGPLPHVSGLRDQRGYRVWKYFIDSYENGGKPHALHEYCLCSIREEDKKKRRRGNAAEDCRDLPLLQISRNLQTQQRKRVAFLEAIRTARDVESVQGLGEELNWRNTGTDMKDVFGRSPVHLAVTMLGHRSDDVRSRVLDVPTEVQRRMDILRYIFEGCAVQKRTAKKLKTRKANAFNSQLFKLLNNNSSTALHIAASFGELEILRFLLYHGGQGALFSLTKSGWLPVHVAANKGHFEAVKLLLAQCADHKKGRTVFHLPESRHYAGAEVLENAAKDMGISLQGE